MEKCDFLAILASKFVEAVVNASLSAFFLMNYYLSKNNYHIPQFLKLPKESSSDTFCRLVKI